MGQVAVGTPLRGNVYPAEVTMGLGREWGAHELGWTPTAKGRLAEFLRSLRNKGVEDSPLRTRDQEGTSY